VNNFDLKNLDFNNAGAWPPGVKAVFCALIVIAILAGGWYFFVSEQKMELEQLQATEVELRSTFETKAGKAANLEPLKQQLADMEIMLQQMLRQLPSKTEMPDLIIDISQAALATGIQNDLFQPQPEVRKEFYAEKPIALKMVGSYHQFGAFVSTVASLPRVVIMTMHDISLTPQEGGTLVLQGTVKTYRYLDEDETAGAAPPAAPAPATGGAP
jgi:type IV pilus assembly protein PilO